MKKLFISLLLLAPITGIFAQCASVNNIYSFTYNGKSYEIIKEKKSWEDAAACALERGGHLVYIDDAAENTAIMQQITTGANIPANYTIVNDGGGIAYLWIGATDKNQEGTWLWDGDNNGSGSNFWTGQGTAGTGGGTAVNGAYNKWGTSNFGSEPDNFVLLHDQDAAGIALGAWPFGTAGQWNDIDLVNEIYFIIEKENVGIGEINGQPEIGIFPNPARNIITIDRVPQNAIISIVSVDGKVLLTETNFNAESAVVDISSLPAGLYFILMSSGNSIISSRFIKE